MTNPMMKNKVIWLVICIFCSTLLVTAQDLGSSTDLFKKSTKPKTTTPKKKPPRKRTRTTVRRNRAPKKTAPNPVSNTPTRTENKAQPKPVEKTTGETESPSQTVENATESQPAPVENTLAENSDDYSLLFEEAIEEGNTERDQRNYSKAEVAYQRARSLQPEDFRAIYGLGNLHSDPQRWEEAENAYRQAIKLEPDSPDAYIALSFVLTQPIAGTNLIERYAEAELLARRAIELEAGNAVGWDQLGVSLELQGNISEQTHQAYQKAIELDPTFALAYAHLGRLLRRKGLTRESSENYVKAIQFSVDVPTMILVAEVMQSQQRYLESEQLLRRALRSDPKNPTALNLLGRALTTRGSFEEAEEILKKSIEVSPNSFVSYTLLGALFVRRENFSRAENYLEEAFKVASSDELKRLATNFEAVADGYLNTGRKPDAVRVYEKAVSMDKNRTDLAEKLARAKTN